MRRPNILISIFFIKCYFAGEVRICTADEASICIDNSNCGFLDNFPICYCKPGYSGSADAETEGECAPDKNEVTVSFHQVETSIPWNWNLVSKDSEIHKEANGIITDILTDLTNGAPIYVYGPWTVKYFKTEFFRSITDPSKADVNVYVVYGVQEETTEDLLEAEDKIIEAVKQPLINSMATATAVFLESNTKESLEESVQLKTAEVETVEDTPLTPCPSQECWDFAVGKCTVKLDPRGNPLCATITCSHDQLSVTFGTNLFKYDDTVPNPWMKGSNLAVPSYDTDREEWTMNCPIGKCNMQAGQQMKQGQHYLTFKVVSMTDQVGDSVKVDEQVPTLHFGAIKSRISVTCYYRSSLSVESDVVVSKSANATESLEGMGTFDQGFSMALYSDPAYTTQIETAFLGTALYVKVQWAVTTAATLVQFAVTDCEVESAKIIRDTCYSSRLHAKLLNDGDEKPVPYASRFSFVTFTNGDKTGAASFNTMTLKCTIKICLNRNCDGIVKMDDDECLNDTGYDYTAIGSSEDH